MSNHGTNQYTTEFRHEFEADTATLFSRRLARFTMVWGLVGVVAFVMRFGGAVIERRFFPERDLWFLGTPAAWTGGQWTTMLLAGALVLALYGAVWAVVRNVRIPRTRLTDISVGLVVAEGLIGLMAWTLVPTSSPLAPVAMTHFVAALFLPWNLWQAIRPMLVLLGANALFTLLFAPHGEAETWVSLALSPALGIPGAVVAWLKHSRRIEAYKLKALARRYGEFRRELLDARKIHESLFPQAITDGPICFWYEYEPMRSIGGDFVFAHCPKEFGGRKMSVVLVDVTGHGIPAALTVNRLHGELERVFAENPLAPPGDVLELLNRYIHLTLAKHSIYATALCVRIDCDSDTLEYASGGHPPAFVRAVDGTVHEIESTAFVLGVCPHPEFQAEPRSLRFGPGDALIAYTDGAMEARDDRGRMLGVCGMRSLVATAQAPLGMMSRRTLSNRVIEHRCGLWTRGILEAVEHHRSGVADDDTLVVEITRPLGVETAAVPAGGREVPRADG